MTEQDHSLQSAQMMTRCKQQYLERKNSFIQSVNVYQVPKRHQALGRDKLCAGRSGHVGAADSGGGDHRKEGKMVKLRQAGKARERHSRWKVWQKQRQGDGEMHSARGADSTWR